MFPQLCFTAIAGAHAIAYIGPGPGLSMLGALVGLVLTILAALAAVLLWPLRTMLKQFKQGKASDDESEPETSAETTEDEDQQSLSDE